MSGKDWFRCWLYKGQRCLSRVHVCTGSNRYLCFMLPSRETVQQFSSPADQVYSGCNKRSDKMDKHSTAYLQLREIYSAHQQFSVQPGSFFDVELAQRQGLSAGSCLCCSYVLPLIYATHDLWVRVSVQDVSVQHTQWTSIHMPQEDRERRRKRRAFSQTIMLSLHRFPSSVWAKQAVQTQPTSSYNSETPCLPPFSQTNPLSPHPPALQDQVGHCVWTGAKVHWEKPAAQSMSNKLQCALASLKTHHLSFSWIAADSKACICHLLPCVNSASCHHHSQTSGWWEGEGEGRGPSGEEGVDNSRGWWWVCGAGVDGWAGRQQGFKWRLTPQG